MDLGTDVMRSVFNDDDKSSGFVTTRNVFYSRLDVHGFFGEHCICQAVSHAKILCCD
jgi:hypothetical protein